MIRDKGILLKMDDLGSNTRLVLLLENYGKIVAYCYGKRLKNRTPISSLVSSYCEFIIKDSRFNRLDSAHIIHNFSNIYTDYDKILSYSLFLELLDKLILPEMEAYEAVQITLYACNFLSNSNSCVKLVAAVFILKLLKTEGYVLENFENVLGQTTSKAMDYIINAPINRMFNFSASNDIIDNLYNASICLLRQANIESNTLRILEEEQNGN